RVECRARLKPRRRFRTRAFKRRNISANRARTIKLDPKQRTRAVEVLRRSAFEHVAHRQAKLSDRKLRSFVESDQRAAFFHELLERVDSLLAKPSADLRRITARRKTVHNLLRALRRNHDAIESRVQIARPDVAVEHRPVLHAKLIEDPSRPTLIH